MPRVSQIMRLSCPKEISVGLSSYALEVKEFDDFSAQPHNLDPNF